MIILICAAAVILIFPIFVRLKLALEDTDGGVYMRVSLLSLTIYRAVFSVKIKNYVYPEIYETRKGKTKLIFPPEKPRVSKKKKSKTHEKLIKAVLRAFKVKRLFLRINIGVGDAAADALICGIFNIILDIGAKLLGKRLLAGRAEAVPQFEKTGFNFKLDCIITISMANIIREVLFKKGGGANAPNRKHTQGNNVRA